MFFKDEIEFQRRDGRRFLISAIPTFLDEKRDGVHFTIRIDEIVEGMLVYQGFFKPAATSVEAIDNGIDIASRIDRDKNARKDRVA